MNVAARIQLALVTAVACFAVAAPGWPAATPPALYVTYDADGTLTVSVTGNTFLSPSSAIPPGPYWVTFDDEFSAERIVHKWHLTGPGVDIATAGADLNCDSSIEQYIGVLQPSSTYTVQDDFHPAIRPVVFHTAATGSSTAAQTSGSSKKSGTSQSNTDIVGSAVLPYRGALAAAVSAAGKVTLSRGGKRVSSLRPGRYEITVADGSAKAGFILEKLSPSRRTYGLTSAPFVGRRSIGIRLGAGQWLLSSRADGPARSLVVST